MIGIRLIYNEFDINKPITGDTLVTRCGPRTSYHLVTKLNYYNNSLYIDVKTTLQKLKIEAYKNNHTNIAISKIGLGLDGLHWTTTTQLIQSEFQNSNINIYIFFTIIITIFHNI